MGHLWQFCRGTQYGRVSWKDMLKISHIAWRLVFRTFLHIHKLTVSAVVAYSRQATTHGYVRGPEPPYSQECLKSARRCPALAMFFCKDLITALKTSVPFFWWSPHFLGVCPSKDQFSRIEQILLVKEFWDQVKFLKHIAADFVTSSQCLISLHWSSH